MEHTPDPQPTVYEGILFVWGFGDAWGLLQGVCWNFLRNNVFFNLISFPARSPLCMHHVYARAERIQIQPPALFDERCWRPSCSTSSATPRRGRYRSTPLADARRNKERNSGNSCGTGVCRLHSGLDQIFI